MGNNFLMVPYKMSEQSKHKIILEKYTNQEMTREQYLEKMEQFSICNWEEIDFICELFQGKDFKCYKVCMNSCPFLLHEYKANETDLALFFIYLEQLKIYYCGYLVRFYGISIKYGRSGDVQSYLLIFDYWTPTLQQMLEEDMILDNMQIATIALQIAYLGNYLHSHDQPRCLGVLDKRTTFWPFAMVLPFLGGENTETIYSL
jgi:hypothetical protein